MSVIASSTAASFFDGHPFALSVFRAVRSILEEIGDFDVRVTKSQVAFRRDRGFAYVWIPGRWLAHPAADVVLSIGLGRRIDSPRFKEVVHPASRVWMHHLEVRSLDELDDEVTRWLAEAWTRAGPPAGPSGRPSAVRAERRPAG